MALRSELQQQRLIRQFIPAAGMHRKVSFEQLRRCLLYTTDAADDVIDV
jgi:hypothetical protein